MWQGSCRGEQDDGGEDEGHGAKVEKALDDVYGELRTEGQAGLFGDEIGADRVGYAANEGDGGEPDHLGAEKRKGRHFFVGAEEQRPANGTENVGEIDAGGADGDFRPVGLGYLFAEDMEVEVESLAAPEKEPNQRSEHHQTQNPLLLVQAFSRFRCFI